MAGAADARAGAGLSLRRPTVRARSAGVLLLLAALGGCTTYSETIGELEHQLAARNYDRALAALENLSQRRRDAVLYLLNKGMLLRMKGDYAASNDALEQAKQRMEKLYATSLSEQALSFVINDASRSYVGEEHEQVLVHLYKALNYLQLGDAGSARVEALQVDLKLREIGERMPLDRYADDPLARYLSGLIYEELGEWSDALIAYRKAYEAYTQASAYFGVPVPIYLKRDLLRLTARQGLAAEHTRFKREFAIKDWMRSEELAERGELVFVLHGGLAPVLRENSVVLPDPNSGFLLRLSLPVYESRPLAISRARIIAGESQAETVVFEDIDVIARRLLDAKMPTITARAIARQVVKKKLAREVGRSTRDSNSRGGDALAGALLEMTLEIAAFASERADTRSWITLPHRIQIARLALSPGHYDVRVDLIGPDGALASQDYPGVEIRAGRKTFLSQHWVPSYLPVARSQP